MKATSFARSLPGVVLAVVVILLALGNSWVGIYPYGYAVWMRGLLGMVGIVGAICLIRGNGWWRILLPVWSLCQSVVIATDVSGEWFYQGLRLGVSSTQSTSVKMNELVTEFSEFGWSTTGLILVMAVGVIAVFGFHPAVRVKVSVRQRRFWIPAVVLVLLMAWGGVRHWGESTATYVLDLDLPNVPIYWKGQLLGRTPLRVTPERVAAWGLPVDATKKLAMYGTGWGDCVVVSDGVTRVPLYAGAPWPFEGYVDKFETPWGERCRISVNREEGNRRTGYVYPEAELRHDPILRIEMLDAAPIAAGSPLRLRCVLHNGTAKSYGAAPALMQRKCFLFDKWSAFSTTAPAGARYSVTMPVTWNSLPAGSTLSADVEFDAPEHAGEYELFCCWGIYKPASDGACVTGSAYSNVLRLRVR